MFGEPTAVRNARSNAITLARDALEQSKSVTLELTPEMLKNPSIYAHFIPLVETIAAELKDVSVIRVG